MGVVSPWASLVCCRPGLWPLASIHTGTQRPSLASWVRLLESFPCQMYPPHPNSKSCSGLLILLAILCPFGGGCGEQGKLLDAPTYFWLWDNQRAFSGPLCLCGPVALSSLLFCSIQNMGWQTMSCKDQVVNILGKSSLNSAVVTQSSHRHFVNE